MTTAEAALLFIGMVGALVVPWVLVASLPFSGVGAARRARRRQRASACDKLEALR